MTSPATGAPVRVLLAVGDRTLERRLLQSLPEFGLVITARCLDAFTLVEEMRAPGVDVVLVSDDLHGFSAETIATLHYRRRPMLILASGQDTDRFMDAAPLLPAGASSSAIASAVIDVEARGPIGRAAADPVLVAHQEAAAGSRVPAPSPAEVPGDRGRVVVVTSGKGAPGKTTVAIALAARLGADGERVVLVDADRRGGNVAPLLDLDPRRGLVGLLAGDAPSGTEVGAELQDGPQCAVLAGLERPELAVALGDGRIPAVLHTLRSRFDWVVVDLADLSTRADDPVLHVADEVLLVLGPDLIAIWNARLVQPSLRAAIGGARLSAVVNRREGREHYDREEIDAALGIRVLGVVREERAAARRAITEQIPLSETGSRAARDLHDLAARMRERRTPVAYEPAPGVRSLVMEG